MTIYEKLFRCVLSCNTVDQLEVTKKLVDRVQDKLEDEESIKLNLLIRMKEYNDMVIDANNFLSLADEMYEIGEYEYSISLTNIANQIILDYENDRDRN